MGAKIDNIRSKFQASKFGKFWIKAHLQYLLLAGLMYGFKAMLYFIIAYIPCKPVMFNMEIDKHIPFISYFYFFYLLYYILPEIFLWILSFFDKKKMITIVLATVSATFLACICYLIQQVKMDRVYYENLVSEYSDFSKVHNLDTFWRWAIDKQYKADETALNCFPSLHATVGMALALVGIYTGKDEKHFPIGLRIFCGLFGLGIILSTVFVKQHYFIDMLVGVLLEALLYFIWKLFIVPAYLKRKQAKQEAKPEVAEETKEN